MDLLLATRNPHKTREFRELLGRGFNVKDLSLFPEIALPEESGRTFEENAALKAIAASQDRQSWVIADDSGLEVDALGGAPGIYSARYAGESASDRNNIDKLLGELRARNEKRSARFRCVIALARNGRLLGTFEDAVVGEIVDPARGTNGFGYDPIFQPDGFEETFAEMAPELKNEISHRAKAIAALREALREVEN
jgi:XTP/dITP diphosphohydrolase